MTVRETRAMLDALSDMYEEDFISLDEVYDVLEEVGIK